MEVINARKYHNLIMKEKREKQILMRIFVAGEWLFVVADIIIAVIIGIKPSFVGMTQNKSAAIPRTADIRTGYVTDIGEVTTDDGNVWDCNTYDFSLGERVAVTFLDMGTDDVLDDEVLTVTKVRYELSNE